ncbi:MAG: HAMP domain-containing protein [Trueperaceae bacterium]|nr:MAG: HAMP domain-containing protein [Trueperaceae bacterium]
MSLRVRLTLFYSAFFVIVLSAVALAVYALTDRSLNASLEERGRQALLDISQGAIIQGLQKLPGDAYYQIVIYGPGGATPDSVSDLRSGVPFTRYDTLRPNPTDEYIPDAIGDAALTSLLDEGTLTTTVVLSNEQRLLIMGDLGTLTIPAPERSYSVMMLIGVPASGVAATLNQLANNLRFTVVAAFIIFALGVWLLSRQVLSPVQRVKEAAARVTSRDLSQRVPVPASSDEMRELAVTLNNMLDRLQESFETQRRFTADASHELRTPVTAIVGHANYLLRRASPTQEQVDSLMVIRREAERMAKLVNDLLELARADAGFSIQKEAMNLLEVAEAVHMEIAPVAGSTEITVTAPQPVVEVMGDPGRLKQVLHNLVQNAINAGASRINISLWQEKDKVCLEIVDDGPGIPEEAIPHLFDRFFRVDGARTNRGDGNGSGLGLAIVRWVVQQHEGTVDVESELGKGTLFRVLLPATQVHAVDPKPLRQGLGGPRGLLRNAR